jgi:cell wall integrity and stress response component
VGPIVGGVVGGVAGIVIVSLIAFFLVRKRRQDEDHDEEEFYDKPEMARGGTNKLKRNKPASPLDRPMSNPFTDPSEAMVAAGGGKLGLVDPRLNPMMMGRRRLSEGSLADETDYSRKILQVANPDS